MTDSHTEDCLSDVGIDELLNTDILPFKDLHNKYTDIKFTNNDEAMLSTLMIDKYIATYSKEWLDKQSNLNFYKKTFFYQ